MSMRTRSAVYALLPDLLPLGSIGGRQQAQDTATARRLAQNAYEVIGDPDFDSWSEALTRVGNCARPIRLRGRTTTVDASTGEILSSYPSGVEPLGLTHVRCGNRRDEVCPSCSRLYAADMFHLIRAGVTGGKTVPESVAENPLVFATVTAPSFGPVHGQLDSARRCHPYPAGPARCSHGRPSSCHAAHREHDPALGQPLCPECYDYATHTVWQWWAPDLWRRFTIALRRLLAKTLQVPASSLGEVATVQYAKVAEYQLRGAVHFHALVRLDGPRTADGFAPAPTTVDAEVLADLVQQAAASVRLTVPGVDCDDPTRVLAFGRQVDVRPVRPSRRTDDPDRTLSPEQVAGYLAKYATKSATDTGAGTNAQQRRLRDSCRHLARRAAVEHTASYELLGKWAGMLGFRGHFATKSRRYSVTLGALRRARRRAQVLISQARVEGRPLDLASLEADLLAEDDDETTLVVGHWQYVGSGWETEAQRVLAIAAAARAREHAQWRAAQRRGNQKPGDGTT